MPGQQVSTAGSRSQPWTEGIGKTRSTNKRKEITTDYMIGSKFSEVVVA
jgi:hypothetical protein